MDRFGSRNTPPTVPPNPQSVATMLEENMVECPAQDNIELHETVAEIVGQDSDSSNTDGDMTHDADATPSKTGAFTEHSNFVGACARVTTTTGNENDTSITCMTATTRDSHQEIIYKNVNTDLKTESPGNITTGNDSELLDVGHKVKNNNTKSNARIGTPTIVRICYNIIDNDSGDMTITPRKAP